MNWEAPNIGPAIDVSLGIMWHVPLGGLSGLWQLPVNHRFQPAFVYHDTMYDLMCSGFAPYETSRPVDKEMYRRCVELADDSLFYLGEARLFYRMCRIAGKMRWRVEGYPEVIQAIYEAQIKAGVPLTKNTEKFQQDHEELRKRFYQNNTYPLGPSEFWPSCRTST